MRLMRHMGFIATLALLFSTNGNAIYISDTSCSTGGAFVPCSYIMNNIDALCGQFPSGGIVNGDSCSIHMGLCNYYDYVNTLTTSVLCEGEGAATASSEATVSSEATASAAPSGSMLPSITCANYRTYSSSADFSSTQGANGWYYGYYSGATFVQFTNYGTSVYTTGYNSWMYSTSSNGLINSVQFMPNGPGSCNTAAAGYITPVLRWYNPTSSCYQDLTITLVAYQGHAGGDGVELKLMVNGSPIHSQTNTAGGALNINTQYNAYSVRSVELSVSAIVGCDYDQTTYTLTIAPMGVSPVRTSSASSSSTKTLSKTASVSASSSASPITYSPLSSRSTSASPSFTSSSSVSKSVSYSAAPTGSLIGSFSYNMCSSPSSSPLTVVLPYSQSYVNLVTNANGSYNNSAACQMVVRRAVNTIFNISFSRFSTEVCCDFLRIADSAGVNIFSGSGTVIPANILSYSPYITVSFTTDASVEMNGVAMQIQLIDMPSTISARATSSALISNTGSRSPWSLTAVNTASSIKTPSFQSVSAYASDSHSAAVSESASASYSPSASVSITASSSVQATHTIAQTGTSHLSASSSYTHTTRTTASPRPSLSLSGSPTAAPTPKRVIASNQPPPALPANLSSLSTTQLLGIFTDLSDYNPLLIKDMLKDLGFAGLSNSPTGVFAVSTDSFDLSMKRLPMNSSSTSVANTNISLPAIPGSSASSAIQWTSSPYSDNTSLSTPVLSLSVLDSNGHEIPVNNLSTPIVLEWNVAHLMRPPAQYMIDCVKGDVYLYGGSRYSYFANFSGTNASLPCASPASSASASSASASSASSSAFNCGRGSSRSRGIYEYMCPTPELVSSCMYWSSSTNGWSTDGCTPVLNGSSMKCYCTHLTDFTTRISAVADQNKAIFDNAGNVYSLEGLAKYANWYGIFGGIAFLTVVLGLLSSRIDFVRTRRYVVELYNNKTIQKFIEYKPHLHIYAYSKFISYTNDIKNYEEPVEQEYSLLQRICFQHTRLQFLFRYDPRLSRIFRLLSLFVLQFHSLFITALLYGFTYTGTPMQWYDSIILALITSALNIPMIRILIGSMNAVGMKEFEFQFPYLAAEYKRREDFEKLALVYLGKDPLLGGGSKGKSESESSQQSMQTDDILDMCAIYLCCRNSEVKKENIKKLERPELLKRMGKLIAKSFIQHKAYSQAWSVLPCHTLSGAMYLACAFGWLGWCLNYLLLFSASHETHVGEKIMISYATSELTTVFITQPLSIAVSLSLFVFLEKYAAYIPFYRFFKKKDDVPALYFFSNPWQNSKSLLTSEFAYAIFVEAPAKASGVNPLVYAPVNAIVPSLATLSSSDPDLTLREVEQGPGGREDKVKGLYEQFIQMKMKLDKV